MAGAVPTLGPVAGLAPRQHARLQQELRQVLELSVDVQITNAAVETSAVTARTLPQGCQTHLTWQT